MRVAEHDQAIAQVGNRNSRRFSAFVWCRATPDPSAPARRESHPVAVVQSSLVPNPRTSRRTYQLPGSSHVFVPDREIFKQASKTYFQRWQADWCGQNIVIDASQKRPQLGRNWFSILCLIYCYPCLGEASHTPETSTRIVADDCQLVKSP